MPEEKEERVAEKAEKSKAPKVKPVKEKPLVTKPVVTKANPEKTTTSLAKQAEKKPVKAQAKQPGRIARWWRETMGELRKVTWPTVPEARRMTGIVLAVMAVTAVFFGILDLIFSRLIALLVSL